MSLSVVFPHQVRCEDAGYYDCTTNIRGSDGNSEENTKSESLKVTGSLCVSFPNHELLVAAWFGFSVGETHIRTQTQTDRHTVSHKCKRTVTHWNTREQGSQSSTDWVTPLSQHCRLQCNFQSFFFFFSPLAYDMIKHPSDLLFLSLKSPTVLAKSVCFCSSESWSFHTDPRWVCFRAESGWRTEA